MEASLNIPSPSSVGTESSVAVSLSINLGTKIRDTNFALLSIQLLICPFQSCLCSPVPEHITAVQSDHEDRFQAIQKSAVVWGPKYRWAPMRHFVIQTFCLKNLSCQLKTTCMEGPQTYFCMELRNLPKPGQNPSRNPKSQHCMSSRDT
jgi:hypothetical protein